jgi:HAMP domain-containing protein
MVGIGAIAGAPGSRLVQYGILGAVVGGAALLPGVHGFLEAAARPARVAIAGETGIGDSLARARPTFAAWSNVAILATALAFAIGGAMFSAVFDWANDLPLLPVVIGGALTLGLAVPITVGAAFSSSLQPIRDLVAGTNRVAAGDYGQRLPVVQDDDLGALSASFNRMQAGLAERQRLQAAFGTYVDPALATRAAREAQSHFGMAHRLATNEDARRRREQTIDIALGIHSVSGAVLAAAQLLELAGDDAKAITEERDAQERDGALRSLGIEPGGTVPPALRAQLKQLDDDQKRRATRSLRDGIDRIMVDLLSLYRDVLLVQLGSPIESINLQVESRLRDEAALSTPAETLASMDAVATARKRIEGNVNPTLALEAMLIAGIRKGRR